MSKVTAVIPVHNRADLLYRMLETASRQTMPFEEVIAVDNASADNARAVAHAFGCHVIELAGNKGFARAVNIGWKAASTEWIAILNSDIELDSQWLERLVTAAEARGAAFATGLILDANERDRIDGSYDLVSRAGCAWRAGRGEQAGGFEARPIAIASGTACVFRREVLDACGGYAECFESYLEDVDLGLRCVREGIEGVFAPDALAWHHGSATLGRWNPRVVRLISRNQVLILARHYDPALLRQCLRAVIAGQLLWGVVAARHGALRPWIAGKLEGLRMFRSEAEPSTRLRCFLDESEREIRRRAAGPYWRWYFRFAGTRNASN